jgi:hypothetical protein
VSGITEPPEETDPRRRRISQLAEWLRGDVATPELVIDPTGPLLTIVRADRSSNVNVSCRARSEDAGTLWFFDGSGRPITEAENIADAALWVRDRARSLLL